MHMVVVITAPADGLAPLAAGTSRDKVMTKVCLRVYTCTDTWSVCIFFGFVFKTWHSLKDDKVANFGNNYKPQLYIVLLHSLDIGSHIYMSIPCFIAKWKYHEL